jgi:ABC-type sugar transport system permease subunit
MRSEVSRRMEGVLANRDSKRRKRATMCIGAKLKPLVVAISTYWINEELGECDGHRHECDQSEKGAYAVGMNEYEDIVQRLERIEALATAAHTSAEKTRRYFLWTLIITVLTVVVPLIGMGIAIPYYLSTLDISGLLL